MAFLNYAAECNPCSSADFLKRFLLVIGCRERKTELYQAIVYVPCLKSESNSPKQSKMKNYVSLVAAAAVFSLSALSSSANAAVVWNWSFGATEAGTFTTNGTFADTAGGSFNFEIIDFTVTASAASDLIGQPYVEYMPNQGFVWDGDSATQFYRSGGSFTNGSNFYVSDAESQVYWFLFFSDGSSAIGAVLDPLEETFVGASPLTMAPVSPVPEPGSNLAMLVLGSCGLMFRRRLRSKFA